MTRPRLLADVCRCNDDRCPWRMDCLRWLERGVGGWRTPHVETFAVEDDHLQLTICEMRLPAGKMGTEDDTA